MSESAKDTLTQRPPSTPQRQETPCPYGCIIDGGVLIQRDQNCQTEHGQ